MLSKSGWSIGSMAFATTAGWLMWVVSGLNAENVIRAEGGDRARTVACRAQPGTVGGDGAGLAAFRAQAGVIAASRSGVAVAQRSNVRSPSRLVEGSQPASTSRLFPASVPRLASSKGH